VSSDWYSAHFGGSFGVLGTCGKVVEFWLDRSPGHKGLASSLRSNSDLVTAGAAVATFTATFACTEPSTPTVSPTSKPTHTPTSPNSNEKVSARAWEHFELVNELRAAGFTCPKGTMFTPNRIPLQFDCRLWRASQLHSQDMADQAYFSHDSQDGRSPWDRAEAQGIRANGENIAAGRGTAQEVLEQWKNSDGHCRNMGNPAFKLFAVGYGFNAGSPFRHYWTQMFKTQEVDLDKSCYPTESMLMVTHEHFESTTSAPTPASDEPVGEPWSSLDP